MPKKGHSKKKGKKRRNEEMLLQRKNSLENIRAGLIQELSNAMTIHYRNAEQYEEFQKQAEQIKENVTASKFFLQRNIGQYDVDIQRVGNEIKTKLKDVKNLEKTIETETAIIEEDYARMKHELIIAKENLISKFGFTNVFRLMHREHMEACLKTEKTRSDTEQKSVYSVQNVENEGIIQVSQLKIEADKKFSSFLSTARECFEKMMSSRTQNIIRQNLLLNRKADQEFKLWMAHKQAVPSYADTMPTEEVGFESDRLNRHIEKLYGIRFDLKKVRDLEIQKAVPNVSFVVQKAPVSNLDEQIERQIEKTRMCTEAIESKMDSFSGKFNLLREFLTDIAEYATKLKSLPVKFKRADYEEIAANIINRISEHDNEFKP